MQGSNAYRYSAATADFSRETRDRRLYVAVAVESWIILCHRREEANVTEFVRTLISVCPPMGVKIGIRAWCCWTTTGLPASWELCTILPGGAIFSTVRNGDECPHCFRYAFHVIFARTIGNRKNISSVATKVAVQLNCKLGGEAWCLKIPLVSTMVIGCDTYRDSSSPHRSASASVASMNKSLTRWYSRVTFHATQQELGSSHASLLLEALLKYSQ
ncbi:hypothetical protein V5799_006842 [Amblyomma americanum]|uniref:Piwi domain-containing protein n=1 Tax=Amblyomma americanum TaxID=6943 RepID=A0AAQ4DV91_AMBAM